MRMVIFIAVCFVAIIHFHFSSSLRTAGAINRGGKRLHRRLLNRVHDMRLAQLRHLYPETAEPAPREIEDASSMDTVEQDVLKPQEEMLIENENFDSYSD